MMQKPAIHSPRRKLTHTALGILTVAFIAAGIFWLQWASTHGIALGYPTPHVHIAALSGGTLRINQGQQFSATATGRDLSYTWNFGDQSGSITSGPDIQHTFQSNGNFTVTVTVTDVAGQSSSDSLSVTVTPPLPTAFFTYSVGSFGDVSFDASSSQADPSTTISTYQWDFGDGSTDSTSNAQDYHYYNSTGTFTVKLIVIDATGQSSQPYTADVTIS